MKIITVDQLTGLGACEEQVSLFREIFGAEVEVTEETAIRYADVFDWSWAASYLLNNSAWEAYQKDVAPALKVYHETIAPAGKAYDEAVASAQKTYDEAIISAAKMIDKAKAVAFARAYLSIRQKGSK